jgi:hypothetical protein
VEEVQVRLQHQAVQDHREEVAGPGVQEVQMTVKRSFVFVMFPLATQTILKQFVLDFQPWNLT